MVVTSAGAIASVRPYRSGDEQGILDSFNQVFAEVCGPGFVRRRLPEWKWLYRDNPAGHRIQIACARDGTVAAHYAGIPQRMDTAFGEATFVHIVDSFVRPEFRRGLKAPGLFVRTAVPWFTSCYRRGDAVPYGFPVRSAERIGRRHLNYHRLRVVDFLCRDAVRGDVEGPAGVEVTRVQWFKDDADQLARAFAASRPCVARRDAEFLNWRYAQRPGRPYEMFEARISGRLRGVLVLQPTLELVPGVCGIVDLVVPDLESAVLEALLAVATRFARSRARRAVLAVFSETSREHAELLRRGFVVEPSRQTLERPLAFQSWHEGMTAEWLAEHWWYSLGDSDLA